MTDDEKRKKGMDVDDVKGIFAVFSEKLPPLLNSLADVLYGKEQSVKYGQAVAGFYKSLKDSGMTDEQAYELTKQYMSAMNLGGMIGQAIRGGGGGGGQGLAFKIKKGDRGDEDDEDRQ